MAEVFVLAGSVSSDLADPAGGRVGDLPGSFPAEEGLGGPLGFLVHVVWAAGLDGRGAVDDVGGMEVEAVASARRKSAVWRVMKPRRLVGSWREGLLSWSLKVKIVGIEAWAGMVVV